MSTNLNLNTYKNLQILDSLTRMDDYLTRVDNSEKPQQIHQQIQQCLATTANDIKLRLFWHVYDLDGRVYAADDTLNHLFDSLPRLEEALKRTAFELLTDLPEGIKHRLYWHINHLDGGSSAESSGPSAESNCGTEHALESFPRLQKAVEQVAFEVFDTISEPERDFIANKVWIYFGSRATNNPIEWGKQHAKIHSPILLGAMMNSLGDLTPQFEKILDDWRAQEGENLFDGTSHTEIVVNLIKGFLKYEMISMGEGIQCHSKAIVITANISSLPPVFDKKPFTSRLNVLGLKSNRLTAIPKEICQLSNLNFFVFSNENSISEEHSLINNFTPQIKVHQNTLTVPAEIGNLSNLNHLSFSSSGIESLPAEIGNLRNLKVVCLNHTANLRELPKEIFSLSPDCEIRLFNSRLTLDPAGFNNLQQATLHHPNYNGPKFLYDLPPAIDSEPISVADQNEEEMVIPQGFFEQEET